MVGQGFALAAEQARLRLVALTGAIKQQHRLGLIGLLVLDMQGLQQRVEQCCFRGSQVLQQFDPADVAAQRLQRDVHDIGLDDDLFAGLRGKSPCWHRACSRARQCCR